MYSNRVSRRTFTATAAGFAAGVFATSLRGASAQDAATPGSTPTAVVPQGFVSARIRQLANPESRSEVTERVRDTFSTDVRALEGYQGYVLGEVIDHDDQHLSIVVFEEESQAAAFDEVGADFIERIDDIAGAVETEAWSGELLMSAGPEDASGATPESTSSPMLDGYIAMRVHTSLPGTDPHEFVPLASEEFVPIVASLPGFEGYLWYPTDEGFVAITQYDSEQSAMQSNTAAVDWANEYLSAYTDGNPRIINANVVYADLPIIAPE